MCGFFITNDPKVDRDDFSIINSRLAFRGPDYQSDLIEHKNWKLYHSRLSIIATEKTYDQPYFNNHGGVLVFNGEILNYKELANKYNLNGISSDTQLLGHLLELDNFRISDLEGFFAFCYVDSSGNLKYCARDRLGVKPLFYHNRNGFISIASEASVLSDLFKKDFSKNALEEYKVFRAPIFAKSYFSEIEAIDPGHCLVKGKYFDSLELLPEKYCDREQLDNTLKEKLRNGVASRLISDVPVGLLFSGGIDSNLIKYSTDLDLKCFTGGFEGDYDVSYAKQSLGKDSNHISISNEEFILRLKEMIDLRKEPLSVPNEVILSFLAESWKREGGKVLLSGEAADELFGGYDRIYQWALKTKEFSIPDFLNYYAYVKFEEIPSRIKNKTLQFFETLDNLSPFEKLRQFFIKVHLPILFRRLDFSLMYAGVEGREPFAATKILEHSLKYDPSDLMGDKVGKIPLRKLAASLINHEFAFTPKVGFPIDIKKVVYNKDSEDRYDNYLTWSNENLKFLNIN